MALDLQGNYKNYKMITIDSNLCIKCGRCVRVCPSQLFVWQLDDSSTTKHSSAPIIPSSKNCIVCGHCVAACPIDAISHKSFPKQKIHNIDYNFMPSAAQLKLLMQARRSNRAFSKDAISNELLMQVLEAAHRAPTAMNSQNVEFLLITDKAILKQVSDFTIDTFDKIAKKLNIKAVKLILRPFLPDVYKYVPRFLTMKEDYENGNDLILRGAVAMLIIHSPKGSSYAIGDCNLAYQNASLMAESLGLSQFYTGFVLKAMAQNKGKLEKILGLEGRIIGAAMALAIPEFRMPKYIDKQDIKYKIL